MHDLMQVFEMMDTGHNTEAKTYVLEAMETLDPQAAAYFDWLNALGYIHCNLSEYAQALAVYDQYIDTARQNNHVENLHIGFHQKAMALRLNHQYDEALNFIMQEAAVINEHFSQDHLKLSVNEYEYGYLSFLMDQMDNAHTHMERCLNEALKTDDLIAQACAYRGLGEIFRKDNHVSQAARCLDQAYDLFIQAGDTIGAAEVDRLRKA